MLNAAGELLSPNAWKASIKAVYSELPTITLSHLSDAEANTFILAQVKLVERGEWDKAKLGAIWRVLSVGEIDFDIDLTGFETAEMNVGRQRSLDSTINHINYLAQLASLALDRLRHRRLGSKHLATRKAWFKDIPDLPRKFFWSEI